MTTTLSTYFSKIGRKGGRKSRRKLSSSEAREMVKVREARKMYRKFHTQCFWSFDPAYLITSKDLDWVVQQLKRHGDQSAWEAGEKLCR